MKRLLYLGIGIIINPILSFEPPQPPRKQAALPRLEQKPTAKPVAAPLTAKKPAAKAVPEFVQTGRSLATRDFINMLDKGAVVTFDDLETLADVTSDPNISQKNVFFWERSGIHFLLNANFAFNQPSTLKSLAAKKVGKNIVLAKEDYLKMIHALPQDLRTTVAGRSPTLIANQLNNLLGIFDKYEAKSDPKIVELKNKRALELWQAVLNYETIPFAIAIISAIGHNFKKVRKPEPAIFNWMIDELVNKMCKNILLITAHLRQNNLLNPLIVKMRVYFNSRIAEDAGMGDLSYLKADRKVLLGLLAATPETCPALVKEKLLEMID